jgi:tetratricopeptide (TPR) repeat protein
MSQIFGAFCSSPEGLRCKISFLMLGVRSIPPQKKRRFSCGVVRSLLGTLVLSALFCGANSRAQSQASSSDDAVQRLYAEAKAAEASGDFQTAVARYESLLQIAPRLAPAYNNLGALYLRIHEFKKASVVLEKGLQIDPRMSSASALLGISLYELGDYGSAKPRLELALRNNPKDDHAELFLANDLIKLGELNSAATHLQQLVNRQPKNQELWYLLSKHWQSSMSSIPTRSGSTRFPAKSWRA